MKSHNVFVSRSDQRINRQGAKRCLTVEHALMCLLAGMAITHDTQGEFMKRFDSVYRIEDGKAKRQVQAEFAHI